GGESTIWRPAFSKWRRGVTASTRPIFFARRASTARPVSIMSRALAAPTRGGRRFAPPHPGTMPSITSGSPIRLFGPSSMTRWRQASASSVPPPMQKPWTSATVGKGSEAMSSKASLPRSTKAHASSASLRRMNSSMSAPAAKPFSLAEWITRPLGGVARRCAAASRSSRRASLEKVFVPLPARSNASQAMPSASSESFQSLSSMRRLPLLLPDVQRLLDIGHDRAGLVHDLHAEDRFELVAALGPRAGLAHALLRHLEARGDRAPRGLQESHRARLVPDHVI